MKAWSHLPNSHHIDWVIESVKKDIQLWSESWDAERDVTYAAAAAKVTACCLPARYTEKSAALDAVWDAAWAKVWDAAGGAVRDTAWNAAQSAVLALVAYDDCDQYINMDYEKLKVYATLSEKPQAMLLLPMVYVWEKLNESMVTLT